MEKRLNANLLCVHDQDKISSDEKSVDKNKNKHEQKVCARNAAPVVQPK